jgi:hypothetical protein
MIRAPNVASPKILIPYNRQESRTVAQAAALTGKCSRTIRQWAATLCIGRRIPEGGPWQISCVALQMVLENDEAALHSYLLGDRHSEIVTDYFSRLGIPISRITPQDCSGVPFTVERATGC